MSLEGTPSDSGALPLRARSHTAILAFFTLAFAWSWLIGLGAQYTLKQSPLWGSILAMVSGFGPSLAGLTVVAFFSKGKGFRHWLSRCLNWRVGWRWYAFAFFLPPAIMLLALAIEGALGGAIPASPAIGHGPLALANFVFVLFVGGPLGEEFGWRGYAMPAITSRLNWRVTSLLIGFAWGLWHLPLFFLAGTPQSQLPFHLFLLSTMAESVMFGWLSVKTGATVMPALVMHTSVNAWLNVIPVMPITGNVRPLLLMIGIQSLIALALLLLADCRTTSRPIVRCG